jgi:hypothetical protein
VNQHEKKERKRIDNEKEKTKNYEKGDNWFLAFIVKANLVFFGGVDLRGKRGSVKKEGH